MRYLQPLDSGFFNTARDKVAGSDDGGGAGAGGGRTGAPRRRQPGVRQSGTGAGMAPAPAPTFAEMQRMGRARPPMPMPSSTQPGTATLNPRPVTDREPVPTATFNPRTLPSTPTQGPGWAQMPEGTLTRTDPWTEPGSPTTAAPGAGGAPSAPNFDPMEWLRQQIMGGAQGEMGRAYDYLGGRIDDDYDMRQKSLEEEMARRGLADSAGEGMYTGRTTDLNVGRRSAKEDLAERLGGNSLNTSMSALQQMLGLGQQGFENDMTYNNYLMQMLGLGYGG